MIRRYGIDTSVLVRLLTGVPEADFARSVQALSVLVRDEGAGVFTSNQVIGCPRPGFSSPDSPLGGSRTNCPRSRRRNITLDE